MSWILTKGDKAKNIPGRASIWNCRSKGVEERKQWLVQEKKGRN